MSFQNAFDHGKAKSDGFIKPRPGKGLKRICTPIFPFSRGFDLLTNWWYLINWRKFLFAGVDEDYDQAAEDIKTARSDLDDYVVEQKKALSCRVSCL